MLRIKNRAAGKNTKSLGNPYSSDNNEAPVEKYPFPKHPPSRSSSNSVESVIPFSLETVSHHLSRTSGTPRWKQPCYPIPIVSPFSFVAMSRIVNEIPLRDKRRPPVLVSGRIPLSEEAMFNEVLKELYYEDSSVCEGDRIGGTGGEGWLIGRKRPRKIPSLPLRLIRHSKSTPRFPESFRASWLSTLLSSSFLAKEQVSRENMGDNGRPPVKLGSFKRLGGIVGRAAGVVPFPGVLLHHSVACLFPAPQQRGCCNNLIKMSGFPGIGRCFFD